jgi:hypothetical protein
MDKDLEEDSKVDLSLCLITSHAMSTYWGVEM